MKIPRQELIEAGKWLDEVYKTELQRPEGLWIDGHPDWEGIGAWLLDVYLDCRDRGLTDELARAVVLRQIQGSDEWRTKHPFDPGPQIVRGPLLMPPGSYDTVLPWTPPKDRNFLRADCWGVPVSGLPFVNRGSSEHPERVLTYFDYKYSRADLERCLDAHRSRGYTHWIRSWPDARSDGGHSIEQFLEDCQLIKAAGFYVHVKLASKDFDLKDQLSTWWMDRLEPLMTALAAGHAADEFGVWEWDAFNIPGAQTIRTFQWMGQMAHDAGSSFWIHFLPEHTSWFADGNSRGRYGFYDDLGTDVDGLDYQTQPTWTIQETQARLVDTLVQFGKQGNRHKLRFFEDQATLSFAHDRPNEADANVRGYLACCTAHPSARVWGYGNGACYPDGRPF